MGKGRTHLEFITEVGSINPNIEVIGIFTTMQERIKVKCLNCGREWEPKAYQLIQGHGCKVCGHKRAGVNARKTHDQFVEEIKEKHPYIRIIGQYTKSSERIQCECMICGNGMDDIWTPRAIDLWSGRGCPRCRDRAETSFPEQAIYFYVKKQYPDAVNRYRGLVNRKELDVYIPCLHIGIEYDGVQWHSRSLDRDRDKYQSCKDKGITLIRIREDNNRVGEIADAIIIRKRPFNLYSLSESIQELMRLLGIDDEIDVQKDETRIKESYYRILGENSLLAKYPLIAKQWHPTKNGRLTPAMISAGSEDEYWWRCEFNHDWKAAVKNRAKGEGCRICKYIKLSEERLKTTAEFKKEMEIVNPSVLVIGEYVGALEQIRCICKTCNHGRDPKRPWMPRPNDLLNGHGCPKCVNRLKKTQSEFVFELKNKHPDIEVLGDYITNKDPIECRCLKCGYGENGDWTPTPNDLLTSGGCPKCSFARRGLQRRKTHEQFVQEMSLRHPTLRIVGRYETNKTRIQCVCMICGYGSNGEWTPRPDKLLQGNGCKKCYQKNKKEIKYDKPY